MSKRSDGGSAAGLCSDDGVFSFIQKLGEAFWHRAEAKISKMGEVFLFQETFPLMPTLEIVGSCDKMVARMSRRSVLRNHAFELGIDAKT